jgi:hypothetical protein
MIASAEGNWSGSYGMDPEQFLTGDESLAWSWESRAILELVRERGSYDLHPARRRGGAPTPAVWEGFVASQTSVRVSETPVRCDNGDQAHSIGYRTPRIERSAFFAHILPRRDVRESTQQFYPGVSTFLQADAGFVVQHLCRYGIGYYTIPGGSEMSYSNPLFKAPSPHRFKQASHKEASHNERRFSAPPYDESFTYTDAAAPNYLATGSFKARVRFVGFPRSQLRKEARALREYAKGGG